MGLTMGLELFGGVCVRSSIDRAQNLLAMRFEQETGREHVLVPAELVRLQGLDALTLPRGDGEEDEGPMSGMNG